MCSECLANYDQCPRGHGPHMIRQHGLASRAGDAAQFIAKVLDELRNVLAESEGQSALGTME